MWRSGRNPPAGRAPFDRDHDNMALPLSPTFFFFSSSSFGRGEGWDKAHCLLKHPANLRLYESHGLTCQKQPANLRDVVWNRPENCSLLFFSFDQGLYINQVNGTTAE